MPLRSMEQTSRDHDRITVLNARSMHRPVDRPGRASAPADGDCVAVATVGASPRILRAGARRVDLG
jgi:hypothetical protein